MRRPSPPPPKYFPIALSGENKIMPYSGKATCSSDKKIDTIFVQTDISPPPPPLPKNSGTKQKRNWFRALINSGNH